jgi:D-arabinose 1-dehydrogenase-like Zn-dependent alcohol dehydrogenase
MKAIVFTSEGTLALEERPTPAIGPRDVLVETAVVGIGGTDVHVLDGEFEGSVFPWHPATRRRARSGPSG